MTKDQIAYFLRRRTPYQVSLRPGCVVVRQSAWVGVIVRPGALRAQHPKLVATIPDVRQIALFVLACFLTFGLAYLAWSLLCGTQAAELKEEIEELFFRELGVRTS